MHFFEIKTHRKGLRITKPHFFILSKGENSGKPMNVPCPNCFVVITNNLEAREFYYWLAYGLWQSQEFKALLMGSVIPFIRIGVAKKALCHGVQMVEKVGDKYFE